MTGRAIRRGKRRARRRVHRVRGSLPAPTVVRVQVTLGVSAISRLDLQVVVIVDVAVGACGNLACWCQLMRIG